MTALEYVVSSWGDECSGISGNYCMTLRIVHFQQVNFMFCELYQKKKGKDKKKSRVKTDPEGLGKQEHQRLQAKKKHRNEKLVIQENFLMQNKI